MRCICGSGLSFEKCCGQYIDGKAAPTAEALMRSRYTAYTQKNSSYLLATWDPATWPGKLDFDSDGPIRWLGLQVLSSAGGGPKDRTGTVEFVARFEVEGRPGEMHERSTFRKDNGRWLYVDGETPETAIKTVQRSGAKVGRNDPCPCGSGRKYKKCCAA